jgi:hypothetical protein
MFYIIEKESQLPQLPAFDECFVHVIPNNYNYHPAISEVSLLYVKPFNDKGYIFCIKHSESLSLEWDTVKQFLLGKTLYAVDAKYTKYFLSGEIHDITLSYINKGGNKFDLEKCEPIIVHNFYRSQGSVSSINELIPISKHYEHCENIFEIIKPYINKNTEYTSKLIEVFFAIENKGIKLDKKCFIKHHEDHSTPQFSVKQGRAYTHYNLYTLTGRPSNSFNNINYAALNKENGERECFIPENDVFIEFDFNGYHPRLLGELVNHKFQSEINVYEQIAQILNKTDIPSVKEITFQNLYGGIRSEFQSKPFFREVNMFTDQLWDELQYGGYVTAPSGKVFRSKDIENANPQKVLNYIIQNFETSQNVEQIYALLGEFAPLKSRIVLYTYDSVLIDVSRSETQKINEIISKLKYPVKAKIGTNYNNLK